MLYAGLFFSFLLTLLALLPLRFPTVGMRIFVVSGLFLSGFTIYFGAILPPVILHFFLLFVALEVSKKRPRLYSLLIIGAAVGAYGLTTLYGLGDQLEMSRLRMSTTLM